jgi:hypothetical protein
MLAHEHKLLQIARVLSSMPEPARLLMILEILPSGYVVIPRQPSADIQEAFQATARRLHEGLKARLAFEPATLPSCWRAMVESAERDIEHAMESDIELNGHNVTVSSMCARNGRA